MSDRFFQLAILATAKPVRRLAARKLSWRFCFLISVLFAYGFFEGLPSAAEEVSRAPELSAETASAQLQGVRFSSQSGNPRVVMDLSADVRYKVGHLSSPERLYLDLLQTTISPRLTSRRIALRDAVVDQIRIGGQGAVTRVVLDLHSSARYQIAELKDPARMVVELDRTLDEGKLAEPARGQGEGRGSPAEDLATLKMNSASPSLDQATNPRGAPSRSDRELGPQTYGSGEKTSLHYAGTRSPRNVLLLGLDFGASYDDNILGNNKQRVGDEEFSIGPSVNLRREGSRFGLALTYLPHFRIYRSAPGLNTLDQAAGLDASYRATSRLSFRARTNATFSNGLFRPGQNQEFLAGLGSPSGLNQTVYTPTLRQLSLSSRVDLDYQLGPHDSVDLYGGESLLNFDQQIPKQGNLSNTQESDAGVVYQHRLSSHATLGMDYLFEGIHYGLNSDTQVHSGFFSYAQQFSPSVTISVFGGPQYSLSSEVISFALGPFILPVPISTANWHWALGGTLTKRLDLTVLEVTAQHQVSNGGGLVGAVVATSGGASVRRRLPGNWDAVWNGAYAKNRGIVAGGATSDYQSETAGFGLERPLTDKLSLRFGYDFLRQRGSGQSQFYANVDRDLFSIQFSYKLHQIGLSQR